MAAASDIPVPLIIDKNLKLAKRCRSEWRITNFMFEVANTDVLYKCQWDLSKEVFLIIKAIQVLTLLSFSFLSAINHGPIFLFQFSKVMILIQTYCSVSSITMNIIQELKISKLRMLQTKRQQQQLELLKTRLHILLGKSNNTENESFKDVKEEPVIELPIIDDVIPLSFMQKSFLKLEWFLRNIYYDYAFTITFMHFIKIHIMDMTLLFADDLTDIANSVEILIDLLICAFPVRVYHVLYSYIFGGFFLLFTYMLHIYDVGPEQPPPETDWYEPDPVIICCYVLVGVTACHVATFSIYQLRILVYVSVYRSKYFSKSSGYQEVDRIQGVDQLVRQTVQADQIPLSK